MANQVVWVDIPVLNIDRAMRFYSAILGSAVKMQEYPGMTMALLPGTDADVTGCLFTRDDERPCDRGPLIYLNAQGRLDQAIAAVEPNGGKVIQPSTRSDRTVFGRSFTIAKGIGWRCIRDKRLH
jgi:uncharacterized protein